MCALQVANKLIVVRCGSVLLAIDQHAADERVQLEALQQQLALQLQQNQPAEQKPGNGTTLSSTMQPNSKQEGLLLQQQPLQPPLKLQLGLSEVKAASMYSHQLEHWGWKVQLLSSRGGDAGVASKPATASSGVTTDALLQQVPVLAGVHLGALDLQVGQFRRPSPCMLQLQQ